MYIQYVVIYDLFTVTPLFSLWAELRNIQSATLCLPAKKISGQKYLQLPTTVAYWIDTDWQ